MPPTERSAPSGLPGQREGPAARLFLAVPLPDDTRTAIVDHLARALRGAALPGRTVAPANWHLTLRFLGETPAARVDALHTTLADAQLGAPFDLGFERLGAFPKPERARVLWLGTGSGAAALRDLASVVERCVVAAGLPPEGRPFRGHLTLARYKPDADVRELLARVPRAGVSMRVDQVVLVRSHLGPSGPRYEAIARYPLDPPPEATAPNQGGGS